MKTNGNFSDANLERLHSLSISCVMTPSDAVDLEWPLSEGMQVSALQPFWIAMIISCWNVKLLKLPSVTISHVCGANSHNRRAKGLPGVGVVKIFCDSDSSVSKSFRLLDSDSTALVTKTFLSRAAPLTSNESRHKKNIQQALKNDGYLSALVNVTTRPFYQQRETVRTPN